MTTQTRGDQLAMEAIDRARIRIGDRLLEVGADAQRTDVYQVGRADGLYTAAVHLRQLGYSALATQLATWAESDARNADAPPASEPVPAWLTDAQRLALAHATMDTHSSRPGLAIASWVTGRTREALRRGGMLMDSRYLSHAGRQAREAILARAETRLRAAGWTPGEDDHGPFWERGDMRRTLPGAMNVSGLKF